MSWSMYQRPGPNPAMALRHRMGDPSFPEATYAPQDFQWGSKRRQWATMMKVLLRSAASLSRRHSSTVRAMGFSTSTGMPASRAVNAAAQCRPVGTAITTASTSPLLTIASVDSYSFVPGKVSA